ncbi:hypothetical protein PILCRDRAFT_812704 [Piloderma croceum F 1598]|uniref:Uncharacterized protein n=1 Tax=Piloderma croceum (strain F 1598) TaxID=765440 RepID=A0A0C3GH19_PILCF|nr:hypothetical protein PILCRDRAFT_812704 [Piloderma croceum F 1598]
METTLWRVVQYMTIPSRSSNGENVAIADVKSNNFAGELCSTTIMARCWTIVQAQLMRITSQRSVQV